jgi:RhtB (resistance to homoserine/threonine) family protein
MDILTGSLVILSIALVAAVSPGPDLLIVLRNALGAGRKAGLWTALGIAMAIYIHVFYSIAGIAVLISQSILLFNLIKYAGAAYLLWLGFKALKSKGWTITPEAANDTNKPAFKSFSQGFITNALNPKATLFFLALFTQVITPDTPLAVQFWYGMICSFTVGGWFCVVALMLTHRTIRQKLAAASVWIDRLTGAAFIALAARIVLTKAH